MNDQSLPGIGHNAGPDPLDPSRNRVNDLVEAANKWLKAVPEIKDEPTAKACDDFLDQIKKEISALDVDRKAINKPHDIAIAANNDAFRPLTTLLSKVKEMLTPLKTGWLKREQDRLAAERKRAEESALQKMREAEELARKAATSIEAAVAADTAAAEAEKALAASKRADAAKATVKGDYTSRSSGLRTYWSAKLENYADAVAHYANRQEVREVIQRLADADAREHKTAMNVPGVVAVSDQRAA